MSSTSDRGDQAASTLRGRRELAALGEASALAYRTQGAWIARRVETVTFPEIEQLFVRRQVSFDFTRPAGLESFRTRKGAPVYLVPLSLMRRWPPRIGVDLRSRTDKPLSLVTARESDALDAGLLVGLVKHVIGSERVDQAIADRIQYLTETHPRGRATSDEARVEHTRNRASALYELLGLTDPAPAEIDPDIRARLRDDRTFSSLARALIRQRVLWVPVTAEEGDQCLVKLTYDARRNITHDVLSPSSFAWVGLKVGFEVPDIGRAGSYHLDIAIPAPLLVKHVRLELAEPDVEPGSIRDPARPVFRELTEKQRQLREGLIVHERAEQRHGSFYVEGDRDVQAEAYVNMSVEKQDYVRGAFVAAVAVLALLVAFRVGLDEVLARRGPAITMLLFVPGLLGYLVVRPGEHWLAAGFLSGVRKLVVANAALPLIAAAALILSNKQPATADTWLGRVWAVLLVLSAIMTVMLLASSFLPTHERWLDDLPRRRAVAVATVAGVLVGAVNGFADLFSWWFLLGAMVLPPLVVLVFSRRPARTEPEPE